jgi:DNA-binding XRE family transcriptional regulator
MPERQSRKSLDGLSPEKRAKVEAMLARKQPPTATAEEVEDREALADEFRRTGTIAAAEERTSPETLVVLRRFISRLREYRESVGISLAEVARSSGIDQPALSRLENGRSNPTIETLSRYAHALGLAIKMDYEPAHR